MKETKANIVKKSEGSPVHNPNNLKWWQRAGMRVKDWWDSLEPSDKAYAGVSIAGILTAGACYFFHDTTEHGYRIDLDLSKKKFSYRPSDSDDDNMES